jgi:Ser/Thr protein kinase RdoA (MazF antagonist)
MRRVVRMCHPTDVRDFDTLSSRGQLSRLRDLGRRAASYYGLEPVRLTLVAQSFNTLFRLSTDDRNHFLLRVGSVLRLHPKGSAEVEAAWLDALNQDATIVFPQVLRNLDNEVTTEVSSAGLAEPRTCMLLRWVPGRALTDRLSPELVAGAGRLLGHLHHHASSWTDRPADTVPVANRVLYWEDGARFDSLHHDHRALFAEAAERAQASIDALWAAPPGRPHLLHGDLTPHNIIQTRRGLVPIDFQDLVWGFDVQDIAISMLPLQRHEPPVTLTAAFRAGYEEVRPWPQVSPETLAALFAARRLLMANLALNVRKPGLDAYIEYTAGRLVDWMH